MLALFAYDVRRDWEDKAAKLGAAFDIDAVAGVRSDDALRRAKNTHAFLFPAAPPKSAGKGSMQQRVRDRLQHDLCA